MAEVHLDHPGEVSWWKGYGPVPVLGDCPHVGCPHNNMATIAWGPDYDHYTLNRCAVPLAEGGCGDECRAWMGEYPDYQYRFPTDWKHVGEAGRPAWRKYPEAVR